MYLELSNQHQTNHTQPYKTGIGFGLGNIHAFAVYHGLIYSNSPDIEQHRLSQKKPPNTQPKTPQKKPQNQATTNKTTHTPQSKRERKGGEINSRLCPFSFFHSFSLP